MRKLAMGIAVLLYLAAQSGTAETIITAQDYAVDSDVVLESALQEIKSAPQDTIDFTGDAVKFVADETVTAANGVAAVFKSNPVDHVKKDALLDVANAWDSSNDIVFRSYKISEAVSEELVAGAGADEADVVDVTAAFYGIDFPEKSSAYLRPEFNRLFVRNTLDNILSIEDVLAELHSAERELMGKQVSIETKFVEVNQSSLNELGFNWYFEGKGADGTGDASIFENLVLPAGQSILSSGLRDASSVFGTESTAGTLAFSKTAGSLRWSMVMSALEQTEDADVLSAPSIVTRDGSTASIMVGEERTVSSGFDVKNSESSLYIEHDLEIDNMGVMLEVTPELRSDSLIDLELNPKVVDLIGYDDYQVHPDAAINPIQGNILRNSMNQGRYPIITGSLDAAGNFVTNSLGLLYSAVLSSAHVFTSAGAEGTDAMDDINDSLYNQPRYYDQYRPFDEDELPQAPALWGRMPYYRLREIETQVTVADGSTVGMGGLIYDKLETYRDKVPVLGSIPFLGRLFRSEGEKSVKRNLMIFVTATQVDANGRKASDLALKK